MQWYSGSGAGGQHRNKHQNCCRIIHKASGLRAQGTESRERSANQRRAFGRLAKLILAHDADDGPQRFKATGRVRTYHAVRNVVLDHASGETREYKAVVNGGAFGDMVEARAKALAEELL